MSLGLPTALTAPAQYYVELSCDCTGAMQSLQSRSCQLHRSAVQTPVCRQRCRHNVVRVRSQQQNVATVSTGTQQEELTEKEVMSRKYNEQMQKQMGWNNPYEYHFDRGLYMHEIVPGLFCGTQPRNPQEVEDLARNHGVTVIMNLQQDKDIQHWGIDFGANQHRCNELGVTLLRKPAQDFDPHSLRKMLPTAVKALHAALSHGHRVYVHCTAGLGRAPAVCIAWLYWYGPYLSLDEAYKHLTDIRPCGPNRDAIRGATYDILDERHFDEFFHLPDKTWAFMNDQDKARLQRRLAERWPQ